MKDNKIHFIKFMKAGICEIELQDKVVVFQMFIILDLESKERV
ncbi:MAG TPA: hypothetical protein VEW92_13050 [Nitrososphaeraceae archaeon]|jgi:hypothetical protein|nr:hypothetical protein [Nitrososphaeraceae archaeon]